MRKKRLPKHERYNRRDLAVIWAWARCNFCDNIEALLVNPSGLYDVGTGFPSGRVWAIPHFLNAAGDERSVIMCGRCRR